MKKNLRLALLLIFVLTPVFTILAQDCTFYFPTKEGTVIKTEYFDKKGKLTSITTQKILKKESFPDGLSIKVKTQTEIPGEDVEIPSKEIVLTCKEGKFYVNMDNYMGDVDLDAYENMDIIVESENVTIPRNPKAGDLLGDGSITITVKNEDITLITITVKISNRKVETIEKVTTPAGTFECFKISYDIETKMLLTVKAKAAEWYAVDIGLVKSESYNKKGKLRGYSILSSISD
jgi:hypothetical protein